MMTSPSTLITCCILGLTIVAAVQDTRSGHIANWLTLPPLVLAPIALALNQGVAAGVVSVTSIFVCAAIPYWMFRRGAAGGGDVKLYGALGALAGYDLGLSVLFLSFVVAACVSLIQLILSGTFGVTCRNITTMLTNGFRAPSNRKKVEHSTMSVIRMGGPIFLATLIILVWS